MDHRNRHVQQFVDRRHAGQLLALRLQNYREVPGLLVLALPRGGVPVAREVARTLGAELDILLVRKLGCPGHEEMAMGAIAGDGSRVLDERTVAMIGISRAQVDAVERRERAELERREHAYRGDRPAPVVAGRTVILVDDGLATGSTMEVAVATLRRQGARRIVVAVPVAPADAKAEFRRLADAFVCVLAPVNFHAVGYWYQYFDQTSDAEVRQLLRDAAEARSEDDA